MLIKKISAFASHWNLLSPGETIVAAVSGGPDSVCLLHILARLSSMIGFNLHAAHLNHGLRGEQSDKDAEYVMQLASQLGVPVTVDRRDVEGFRIANHMTLEEAARIVRYTFLEEVADKVDANKIAVGHTADDQVETILQHFLRGTGLNGLQGMSPDSTRRVSAFGPVINVIRPLLEVSRAETEHYCNTNKLAPHYDVSNLSLSFSRNRVRLELLPYMRTLNSNVDQAIIRLSRAVSEDLDFLEKAAEELQASCTTVEDSSISLSKTAVLQIPHGLLRHVLRLAIKHLLGDMVDIEMVHIDAILNSLRKPTGTILTLSRGLTFHVGYGEYTLSLTGDEKPPYPIITATHQVTVPGHTRITGWTISTKLEKVGECEHLHPQSPCLAHFDFGVTGENLVVRGRRSGDRFQPLGMISRKKVQDLMVDEKVPRNWRNTIPILTNGNQILWVVGFQIDERAKVTYRTSEVLHVQFIPEVTART